MGCRQFANGPLRDQRVVQASQDFVPVFIDTLNDLDTTTRFNEKYGSYPVLRVHDLKSRDIGGRIDTNRTAGITGATDLTEQFKAALTKFKKAGP